LTLGRHYSVLHTHLATYTLGGLVWGNALDYFRDGSVLRLDNSVRYELPNLAGFGVRMLYAFGEQADTSVGQVVNPSVNYARGPWQVGASYMRRAKAAGNVEHYASAGTSIDLAWVKLALALLPAARPVGGPDFAVAGCVRVVGHDANGRSLGVAVLRTKPRQGPAGH
jgi:predicted porin